MEERVITVDNDGFIMDDLGQSQVGPNAKPYLATVEPDGTAHRFKVPPGNYVIKMIDGAVVDIIPHPILRIAFLDGGYCTWIITATGRKCVPPW